MDGVTVERASNTVNDLVDGVTMTLSAVTSKAVSLTGSTPTSALSTVVSNFVSTFNDNMTALNKAIAVVLAFVFGINAGAGGTAQPPVEVPTTARFDENGVAQP